MGSIKLVLSRFGGFLLLAALLRYSLHRLTGHVLPKGPSAPLKHSSYTLGLDILAYLKEGDSYGAHPGGT